MMFEQIVFVDDYYYNIIVYLHKKINNLEYRKTSKYFFPSHYTILVPL